jgi:hypothetical protein
MVKKYIINDLYCIIYSIDNIITDGFVYSIPNKKKIPAFIPPINMTYYRHNKPLVSPSVIICISLTELNRQRITSSNGKSCNFFPTL